MNNNIQMNPNLHVNVDIDMILYIHANMTRP